MKDGLKVRLQIVEWWSRFSTHAPQTKFRIDEIAGQIHAEMDISDWAYALLADFHPGWEINEGSEGYIASLKRELAPQHY